MVAGEMDLATVPQLHDALMVVLRDGEPHVIHVDLSGVTFMDSTGINELVHLRTSRSRWAARSR
jgi:anti-sigma B factor antagonist